MKPSKLLFLIIISFLSFSINAQDKIENTDTKKSKKEKKVKVEKPKLDFTRTNEIGVTTSNFKTFGINVKFGKNENLWRINTSKSFVKNETDLLPEDESEYQLHLTNESNAYLSFGREKRVVINDKYEVKFGLDLNSEYKFRNTEVESRNKDNPYYYYYYGSVIRNFDSKLLEDTLSFGVNLVLGAHYIHIEKFVLGFEILPGVNYNFIKYHDKTKNLNINGAVTNLTEEKQLRKSFSYNISDLPINIFFNYRF